jgi:hypothetical protein
VLGANDGVVSTASLVVGVAAAGAGCGERADLERESRELETDCEFERRELAAIGDAHGAPHPGGPDLRRHLRGGSGPARGRPGRSLLDRHPVQLPPGNDMCARGDRFKCRYRLLPPGARAS